MQFQVFDNKTPHSWKIKISCLIPKFNGTTGDVESNFKDYINDRICIFSDNCRGILKEDILINPQNHLSSMQNLLWIV